MKSRVLLFFLCLFLITRSGFSETQKSAAKEPAAFPETVVAASRSSSLVGIANSASEGVIGASELGQRTYARPGEILEAVPGMIITQHTGGGKANQYYLRGFNLDHGTDFATYVDDVPLNLPTHAHGQGYTDTNWVIPELVERIDYQKGPYYADQGDFANAGSANLDYYETLPKNLVKQEWGTLGYNRTLLAGSAAAGPGNLLGAFEFNHNDGAWYVENNVRKFNGISKYSLGDENFGGSLTAQGYYSRWRGTDQIPQRLIDSGFNRFDSLDGSTGGDTHRFSGYGEWHRENTESSSKITAYLVHYNLDLFSNFTYFLDQENGDQIEQRDDRFIYGLKGSHTFFHELLGLDTATTFGLQFREDVIDARLNKSKNRNVLSSTRRDDVLQFNISPWMQNKTQWLSWLRSIQGFRTDIFHFDDKSDNPENSGKRSAARVSPKLSLVFGPWAMTELYAQGGFGFRTNDARGIFGDIDPATGNPSNRVSPISPSRGGEIGLRSSVIPELNTTLSFWVLQSKTEAAFAGDSGRVEDLGRPGRRYGVEWNNFYSPFSWLTVTADWAISRARFIDGDPDGTGNKIPEAISSMVSPGITIHDLPFLPWLTAGLNMRYFGSRDLIENGTEKSSPSTVFNGHAGYRLTEHLSINVELLNLFNAKYNDNEYFYSSRLSGEAAGPEDDGGFNDHMVHAGEPFSVRIGLKAEF